MENMKAVLGSEAAAARALDELTSEIIGLLSMKLPDVPEEELQSAYEEHARRNYLDFFRDSFAAAGVNGLVRGYQMIAREEREFWRGLEEGGIERCLLPSDAYKVFCKESENVFQRALLAMRSGVFSIGEEKYVSELAAMEDALRALDGEERRWANSTFEEMRADLDFLYKKSPLMSFRLFRHIRTGERRRPQLVGEEL